jgi:excisionase family DNA binding protein
MDELQTAEDVSRFLGVCLNTVYRLVGRGELPAIRRGRLIRFRREDVEAWVNQHRSSILPPLDSLTSAGLDPREYDRLLLIPCRGGGIMSPKGKAGRRPFGSVFCRPGKGNVPRWYTYFRIDGRRVRQVIKGARSEVEANQVHRVRAVEVFQRKYGLRREEQRAAFEDFAKEFIELHSKQNKRSWRRDETSLNNLLPFFKGRVLQDISAADIERYKAKRREDPVIRIVKGKKKKGKKKVSPATVNREIAFLKTMFNKAVEWGRLESSPAARVKKFRENNAPERVLSFEEEKRLLEASPEHLKPVILTALHTGMRRGEILALQWTRVDLKKKTILITKTKGGKDRTIPINDQLYAELVRLKQRNGNSDRVFLGPAGRPLSEIKTAFSAAKKRAKVKGLRFHDLRHTAATRLVEAGVDLITVRDILGHHSVVVTQRYAHTPDELKRRAVESLVRKPAEAEKPVPILSPKSKEGHVSGSVSIH